MQRFTSTEHAVAEWREHVCAPASRSSRLMFALCVAFAAPLCRLLGRRAYAFHLHGDAGNGHAAALYIAAAVYGGVAGELRSWPEFVRDPVAVADDERDGPLLLDDFDSVDPDARPAAAGAVWSDPDRTRPVALSAGIAPLKGSGMIDIPADAGCGVGVFERDIGGHAPDVAAGMIARNALHFEGVVGTAWLYALNQIVGRLDRDPAGRSEWLDAFGLCQGNSTCFFEAPALAGETATTLGLTGWAKGQARDAVVRCARAWASAHQPDELATWGRTTS